MASLKYPKLIINTVTDAEKNAGTRALTRIEDNTKEEATAEGSIVAIMTSLILVISIMYMYWTSRKNLNFFIKKNSASYTFSEALEHSEKIGSIILIVLFLAFLQTLYTIQNFNGTDLERSSIIAVNYVVILGLLLLFYISPDRHIGHGTIAAILSTVIVYSTSMTNVLYHKYYKSEDLWNIDVLSKIILAFYCFLVFIFVIFIFSRFSGLFYVSVHHILGFSELSLLLLYAIFIAFIGQLPKILSDTDLVCFTK